MILNHKNSAFIALIVLNLIQFTVFSQQVEFRQKLVPWSAITNQPQSRLALGLVAIPQIEIERIISPKLNLDAEASVKLSGFQFLNDDQLNYSGNLLPYRAWLRLSSDQFEFRIGLQKISFGSARTFRPLMWFETMDPRDPLQLSQGSWAALFRYYFPKNANLWLWAIYSSKTPAGWERAPGMPEYPEIGGRFQIPIRKSEAAISLHHRKAFWENQEIYQNRIGFDVRFDALLSFWFESYYQNETPVTPGFHPLTLPNKIMANVGMDYTFPVVDGLLVTYEFFSINMAGKGFTNHQAGNFSILNASLKIGNFDRISIISMFNHENFRAFPFFSYQHTFKSFDLSVLAYNLQPELSLVNPQDINNLLIGKVLQVMLIYDFATP